MIHFDLVPEPAGFDENVRKPGGKWLVKNPNPKRPKDYWSPYKGELANGFHSLCAYGAMFEPVGTVDHYLSWDDNPDLAYEWSNYRYCSHWINSSKRTVDNKVLDPFQVGDNWFELLLPSLQLVLSANIPEEKKEIAKFTLTRLHLDHDERVLRQRREWYRMYQEGEITLEGLRKKAPLIARAIEEQG